MYKNKIFKSLLCLILLGSLSVSILAKPITIGKDQAPINAHDYAILKKVAENAQIPVEKFRHYKRNHYIVGEYGLLYRDIKKWTDRW